MCGIVGALLLPGATFNITREYLDEMRDTMFHRGPDGGSTWLADDARVGLAHRRLSIIDLSISATQPMSTADQRFWITFNGEIYNHQVIREELIDLGYTEWKTNSSDTEVILYAFAEWGIECLHKFIGMFAFGIWDALKSELWLVRDRIGVKPLYYSIHNHRIVFASEIKALLKDPEQKRAVNEVAFYNYLSFLTTPAPQTLFEGIYKLPPGTWMHISAITGEKKEHRYWDVWDYTSPIKESSEEQISKAILEHLRDSVKLRQVSDVPVGVFLSGGIDSSTNAALFSENSDKPVHTFSIGYHGTYKTYTNELHYAKEVADIIGARYYEKLLCLDDLLDFLPQMVYLQDEPIADPVCVPVYYVSKLARDNGVIVCQVGEGADELFWGYQTWKTKLKLQQYNNIPGLRWAKRLGLKLLKWSGKNHSVYYEALRRGCSDIPVFWGGAEAFTEEQKRSLLSSRLRDKFENYTSWEVLKPIWERFQSKAWDKSILHWMSYLDLNLRLPELLLMRVDKMSMGVSLEGRVPFLDHRLVQYALSIPTKIKTKNGQLKYILKKAVRGIIPDSIIDRKKQGFGVPVYEWLFDKLGPCVKQELKDFCEQTDYLDYNAVMRLIDSGQAAQIWYLFNFVLWWKAYIKDSEQSKRSAINSHITEELIS